MCLRPTLSALLILGGLLLPALPVEGLPPPGAGGGGRHPLADSLLGRIRQTDARVLEAAPDAARLEIRGDADLKSWTPLTFVSPSSDEPGAGRLLGEGEIRALNDGREIDVRARAGAGPLGLVAGQTVRVYLERRILALAIDPDAELPGTTWEALLREVRRRLIAPVLDVRRLPAFADTAEALQEARRGGADRFGWLTTRGSGDEQTVEVQTFSVKDGAPDPPIRIVLRRDEINTPEPWSEDPAGALPGCRPAGVFEGSDDPALDAVPRRFRRDVVDVVHADRIDSWRMDGDSATRWQSYPLRNLWPALVPTRWPIATMLPLNSYFSQDRSEARVTYTLCSNQRARYLLVTALKAQPDSIGLELSDGPLDSLKSCTPDCLERVNRVDPVAGYRRPPGLPRTAAARIALARVDQGPTGLPAFDAGGYVKTRKSAVVYYDAPSATLWLSSPDTAFQVPGRFGPEVETYRVGRAGPPGFLVTSAAPIGEPDRLEFWVWDDGRLTRRWRSEPFPGSITAIYAGDLDGDSREDLWLACRDSRHPVPRTLFHYYRAAATRPGEP